MNNFIFLDDLFKVLKLNPTPKWRQLFDKYLSDLPSYYVGVNIMCACKYCVYTISKVTSCFKE
jgi:hypothetical protein